MLEVVKDKHTPLYYDNLAAMLQVPYRQALWEGARSSLAGVVEALQALLSGIEQEPGACARAMGVPVGAGGAGA